MKEGMNDFININKIVPEAAQKQVAAKKAEIVAGKFHPFTGPIKGNDGSIKVPAGKTLSDKEIDSINWYVEGVEGKVPGK